MPSNETITSSTPVRRTHLEVRRTAGEELTVGNSCLRANENPVVTERACSGDVEEDHSGPPGGEQEMNKEGASLLKDNTKNANKKKPRRVSVNILFE